MYDKIYAPIHMTLDDLLLRMQKVCCCGENVCSGGRTRILTDYARKRNRKEVLANYIKTRMNIDHQHERWMELKEASIVQTDAEVPLRIKFGTCIINDAWRQTAKKKKENKQTTLFGRMHLF
jgi:hypothetical protein